MVNLDTSARTHTKNKGTLKYLHPVLRPTDDDIRVAISYRGEDLDVQYMASCAAVRAAVCDDD